jgi:thiol-disulfide isomerase/thioredoxin
MKRKLVFILSLFITINTYAQNYAPPSSIPPYHILTTRNVYVTPVALNKDKPVMIIYFSPDCTHCEHLMEILKPQMKFLKYVQVVMITYVQQMKPIEDFYKKYNLKKHPNFTVGTEGYSLVVQRYYQLRITPYIALYGRDHKLVKFYEKTPPIDELIANIKKL